MVQKKQNKTKPKTKNLEKRNQKLQILGVTLYSACFASRDKESVFVCVCERERERE